MSLERFPNEALALPDKFIDPIVSTTLGVQDQVVRVDLTAAAGSITITLPPVAEAAGKWYTVVLRATTGGRTCTVADQDDSESWGGDMAIAGDNDAVVLFSDGLSWFAWWRTNNVPS